MKTPLKGELIKVNEYFIGPGRVKLKVAIAEDGGMFFGLPVNRGTEEHLISLDNENAVEILKYLLEVLETPSRWPKRIKRRRKA